MNLAAYLTQSTSGIGVFGAIVGGAAAAAKNYKDNQDGLVSTKDAVINTSKETAGAGLATVVSAVAAGAVGSSLALSLGTAVVVAAGAKYAWDRGMEAVDAQLSKRDMDEIDSALAD
ncbi:MAG: magnetosome protein MamC [Gammaproteobacteria bacterium SHHR-1]|uniref:magnetosome protein MamC n=1 Tax=Magnetovirga frankeli TaxID=947516 RepID=UPI001AFABB74|nr:magnetosome protein MamC [gamma proteobacterium SS-5]